MLVDIDIFEGFCEIFIYLMSINKGRMTKAQCAHVNLIENLVFFFSFGEERRRGDPID